MGGGRRQRERGGAPRWPSLAAHRGDLVQPWPPTYPCFKGMPASSPGSGRHPTTRQTHPPTHALTWSPRATRKSHRWEPTNPAPPVTSTRFFSTRGLALTAGRSSPVSCEAEPCWAGGQAAAGQAIGGGGWQAGGAAPFAPGAPPPGRGAAPSPRQCRCDRKRSGLWVDGDDQPTGIVFDGCLPGRPARHPIPSIPSA